jgi:hypothetical protein
VSVLFADLIDALGVESDVVFDLGDRSERRLVGLGSIVIG